MKHTAAVLSHGYTSHKGSILNWAFKIAELNIPSVIFDQPGHYLGSFNEVKSFDTYTKLAPHLFESASKSLEKHLQLAPEKFILGGHSLGALLSLKASEDSQYLREKNSDIICVGYGIHDQEKKHLFETPLFQETMNLRAQLISSELGPEKMLPWIKKEKLATSPAQKSIYLLAGEDDLIIDGLAGLNRAKEILESKGSRVHIESPKKLSHHTPELAGVFIKKYLKKIL